WDTGIRFAVSDTSADGCDNPSPNSTFYDVIEPGILLVPRRPNDMAYFATTPAEWLDWYNGATGSDLTYAQLLQQVSGNIFDYLMRGDADPWMFHQANLRSYDGVHSILGNVIDRAVLRFEKKMRVPVRTPTMEETALRFARRLNVDTAGVR